MTRRRPKAAEALGIQAQARSAVAAAIRQEEEASERLVDKAKRKLGQHKVGEQAPGQDTPGGQEGSQKAAAL